MAKGLALPRSFRGTGDLRVALERNWKHTISHMNTYLVGIDEPGQLTVSGFDLRLGAHDQTTRGDSGSSRALVKADGYLGVNWAGDFGYTRIYNGSNDYFQVGTTGGVNGTFLIADGVQIHSVDANGRVKIYNSFGDEGGYIDNVNTSGRRLVRLQGSQGTFVGPQLILYGDADTSYPGDIRFQAKNNSLALIYDDSAGSWTYYKPIDLNSNTMTNVQSITLTTSGAIVHGNPNTGSITWAWEDNYWRARFGSTGTPLGIAIDNYDTRTVILGRTGNIQAVGNLYLGSGAIGGNDYIQMDETNNQWKFWSDGGQRAIVGHGAAIAPGADNVSSCGADNLRFTVVYATTGTINTSDPSLKDDVVDSDLGLDFVKSVRPIRYKFKDGVRPHYGFDAAQVKATIDARGVDFAGFIDPTINPNVEPDGEPGNRPLPLGLRYSEFIAPAYQAIRELDARLSALEAA